ncbi:MAG: lipid IV(A) 3-deoxy-D-manno-octulosonic acid transferase [Pseudomonadota bacterium]
MRWLYTLILWLLLPWIVLRLFWRARKQPEYLRHVGERFGFYAGAPQRPLIWLHAVSVGETRAALPLVKALREKYPQHRILLTHMTPTGRDTGEQLFGADVLRCYLPYDFPFALRRFLRHYRPAAGVLMETELWFNLIHECRRSQVPLYLVNARLSEKSAAGYARFASLTADALNELAGIAAQSEDDRERLLGLGARQVEVMGNLKFDITPPPQQFALGEKLRASFGTRPVLLAASTREGEEALLLDALGARELGDTLLVLVPRHPQRFDEVAQLLGRRGVACQRRSEGRPIDASTRVVLGDSMGELFAYYAACDVAIVGGSLLSYGGQNLIEACAVGKPVLLGPHTYNFAEAVRLALAAGAARQCGDVVAVLDAAAELLRDDGKRREMGKAALAFSQAHRGATETALRLVRF